ncbi:MAG: hypothetical protein GF311_28365 [Candidatus Lokiarchaeota archaeon]|nr:hypothetical protein [Candidatus Lokiarchaeota archaeon]
MKIILWIYVKLIRPWTSFLFYYLWDAFVPETEGEVPLAASIQNYSNFLKSFKYKSDPIFGLIDFSPRKLTDIFRPKKTGNDCDDRSWYWFEWAKVNCDEVYEVIYTSWKIWNSHAICIFRIKNQWHIASNYLFIKKGWRSFDDIITYLKATHKEKLYFQIVRKAGKTQWSHLHL